MTVSREQLSIRTRLQLLALVVALPLVSLLGWFVTDQVRQARESARARVELLAAGTADDLRRFLVHLRGDLGALAERPDVRRVDPERCDPFLGEMLRTRRAYAAFVVRDARGRVVCVHPQTPDGRAVAEAIAGAANVASAPSVSGAFAVPVTGRWYAAVQEPLTGGGGAGAVSAVVDLQWLNGDLLGGVPEHAVVSVTDGSRTLLLRSAHPEAYIGARPAAEAPDPLVDLRDGFGAAAGRDGVVRLIALRPVPGTDWRVVAGLPEQDAMGPARGRLTDTIGIVLLALLLSGLLAWRISAAIGRPIHRLAETAAAVAAGNASARAELRGPPEVGAVARQFNAMLDARALSEAQLRGIFDSAVDAIIVADERQRVVQANPAAAAMFRTTIEDMVGSPLERFVPLRSRASHRAAVEDFGRGDSRARHMGIAREVQALRADGTEFPIEASISQIAINGLRLYTVIHRDATERSRAQQQLTEGKAKLEAALASMNDAVIIADAEGRFHDVNEAFARFLRCPGKVACPHSVADTARVLDLWLADGTLAPPGQWPAARALRGETGSGVEYALRRKDTGERWIGSFSFAPIHDGDIVTGAVVVARDVTAAKAAQAELATSHAALQRLLSAQDRVQEEERARIARELHDDLQQILAAIRIDLGELVERLQAAGSAEVSLVREVDSLATRAIVSTRRIVDDLRPQMIEDLGLVPTLQHLAAQFSRRTGVGCEVTAADELGESLKAHPRLATCLFRVAQEALNNVAKHAQARHVEIRLAALASGQIAMSVTDDGRGLRSADRRKAGSFGLQGMQERVRAQGGSWRVERLAAGGTLVEAVVPQAGPPEEPPHEGLPEGLPDDTGPWLPETAPIPRLLTHTARQTLQAVIDAMRFSVAIVDTGGVVRFVNRAWVDFAERHGHPGSRDLGPGVNYLEVCRRSARDEPTAALALHGLEDVIAGRAEAFSCEYPCRSGSEDSEYRMHVAPMSGGDLLVMHVPVSHRVLEGADRPDLDPTQHHA